MSRGDVALRALEREAQGDPAAEVRLLVARLRAAPVCERCGGTRTWRDCSRHREDQVSCGPACGVWKEALPCPACAGTGSPFRARLELAAYCGSEAARGAVGWPAGKDCRDCGGTGNAHHACCDPECCPEGPGDECGTCEGRGVVAPKPPALDVWLRGLSRWADVGPVPGWVRRRAALAASTVAHEAWWGNHKAEHHSMPTLAPGLCCYGPHRAIRSALNALLRGEPSPRLDAEWVRAFVEASPPEDPLEWLVSPEAGAPPEWTVRDEIAVAWNEVVPGHAAHLAGEAPVRTAICSALTSWALETPA